MTLIDSCQFLSNPVLSKSP